MCCPLGKAHHCLFVALSMWKYPLGLIKQDGPGLYCRLINAGLTLHRETFLNMAVIAGSQVETANNEINANGVNANC